MEFKAEQKYMIISPRKVRPVVDLIKKMSPIEALSKLPFIKRKGSDVLLKVLKSAIANASQKGVDSANLVFKEIQIGEGPRLRRGQPVSRGRWHPIKKRMSHIRIILTEKTVVLDEKQAKTEETKKSKEIKEEVKKVTKSKTARKVTDKKGDK